MCSRRASTSASSRARPASKSREESLEAGAHVLVEKPFTSTRPTRGTIGGDGRAGKESTCSRERLELSPIVREAKRLMTERGIGRAEVMAILMASQCRELLSNRGAYPDSSPCPARSGDLDRAGDLRRGLRPGATHACAGLALWLTGLRGEEVFALMSAPLSAPVELHDAFSIRYEGRCHRDDVGWLLPSRGRRAQGSARSEGYRLGRTTPRRPRARARLAVQRAGGRGAPHVRAGRRSLRLRRAASRRSSTSLSVETWITALPGARCADRRDPRCRLPER